MNNQLLDVVSVLSNISSRNMEMTPLLFLHIHEHPHLHQKIKPLLLNTPRSQLPMQLYILQQLIRPTTISHHRILPIHTITTRFMGTTDPLHQFNTLRIFR